MKRLGMLFVAMALFGLAVVPFVQSARFGLAPCDDYCYVQQKGEIRNGISTAGVAWAFRHVGDGIWMPGTWISYQLDWTFFDGKPTAFHIHSLAIHGLNAVMLWWLLMALMPVTSKGRWWTTGVAALIWAVHPLRAESVVWIASRKDVLSMFWLLSSLIAWVWGRKRQGGQAVIGYVMSLVFVCLGAMCKPSVNVYPLLVFLLDWLVLGSVRFEKHKTASPFPFWLAYVVPLCICVAITIEGAWAQYAAGGFTSQKLPLYGRALNLVAAFGLYVWNTICPLNLAVDCVQKWPHLPRGLIYGVPTTILAIWYFCIRWKRLRVAGFQVETPSWFLLGTMWFCGSLLPFMTAFGIHAQADRFTYIPALGLCFLVVASREWWLRRYNDGKVQFWNVALALTVLCLAGLSVRQTSFWKDERTLYEHTLHVDGEDNYRAQILLGIHSWNVDYDLEKAAYHIDKAYKINPSCVDDFKHIYIFVLNECNRKMEAKKLLQEMTAQWEHLQRQKLERGEIVARGENPRYLMLARAACFIADPNMWPAAETELAKIEKKGPRYRLLYYLKGRLAWVRGDKDRARQHWRDMLSKGEGEEYLRCSFVEQFL